MTIIDASALLALYVPGRLSDFVRREIGRIKEERGECYVLDLVFMSSLMQSVSWW